MVVLEGVGDGMKKTGPHFSMLIHQTVELFQKNQKM